MAMKSTDILAAMADRYNEQTAQMLDIAIAVVLVKMGEKSISFSAAEMLALIKSHRVTRELKEPDGGGSLQWTLSIEPFPEVASIVSAILRRQSDGAGRIQIDEVGKEPAGAGQGA